MKNRFDRLMLAIGNDAIFNSLNDKCVAIIGIGGVGGYACEAIARSNIGKIVIMDFDKVDITNINRQIIALDSTVGKYKVDVMKERLLDINPNLEVIALKEFYNDETKELIFKENPDFIIDAFDTISGKIDLINECLNRKIKCISSMGMANRFDPSMIKIMKLENTLNDPVARILRPKFKGKKVMVVSSLEQPKKIADRVLSSTAFVPSVAGLYLASYVINTLLKG